MKNQKNKKQSSKVYSEKKSVRASNQSHGVIEAPPEPVEELTTEQVLAQEAEAIIEVEAVSAVSEAEIETAQEDAVNENFDSASAEAESENYKVEFPGVEILRERAPKVAEVADAIYDEWKKDGNFQELPITLPPLAQVAVGMGLRKAKDLEKKLDEKGVFAAAKMGVDFAKMKIEQSSNPLVKHFFKK